MAKLRKEFSSEYKWNTKDLFNSDDECLLELELLDKELEKYQNYQNKIMDSAKNLYELLSFDSDISMRLEKLYIYGHTNHDAETTNVFYQELFGKIKNLAVKHAAATAYIVPEILKSEYSLVEKYLKELKDLQKYELTLKHIFRSKEHILSSEVESALSQYANVIDSAEDIASSLTDSDFSYGNITVDGEEVELTDSNYSLFVRSNDGIVRASAFTKIHEKYAEFKNTLANTLRVEVEKNIVNAKLRNYKNSLEASLFKNEIDSKVYTNLIDSVHNNLEPLYKYFGLKKKILGLDELHIYDTYADITKSSKKKYSYEDATKLIKKALEPLGENYQTLLDKAFNEGWIDWANNEGKRGGAYCTACYSVHPYVLMSYEETLEDISTLAHELGHAMHYYYACQNQSFEDYGYSIFVAEVASQVNEILLSRYLLENTASKEEKLKIIDDLLQKYKSTIFRQTMFAEFELFMHEYMEQGNVLTHEVMGNKYYELNELYFGDGVLVDDLIRHEYLRIPHFYMNYYVYQYATGFTAAVSIANKIYEGKKDVLENYLEFLKLGCTKNPIDSLKVAGVDMTSGEVFADCLNYMDELVLEYEKLLGSENCE